jgi:hypothetical protein
LQLLEYEIDEPEREGSSHMANERAGSTQLEAPRAPSNDVATNEIGRLLGLVKRLEYENMSLRRELAATRPLAA